MCPLSESRSRCSSTLASRQALFPKHLRQADRQTPPTRYPWDDQRVHASTREQGSPTPQRGPQEGCRQNAPLPRNPSGPTASSPCASARPVPGRRSIPGERSQAATACLLTAWSFPGRGWKIRCHTCGLQGAAPRASERNRRPGFHRSPGRR